MAHFWTKRQKKLKRKARAKNEIIEINSKRDYTSIRYKGVKIAIIKHKRFRLDIALDQMTPFSVYRHNVYMRYDLFKFLYSLMRKATGPFGSYEVHKKWKYISKLLQHNIDEVQNGEFRTWDLMTCTKHPEAALAVG